MSASTNRNGYLQRKEEKEKEHAWGEGVKVCMARSTCLHKTHALVAQPFNDTCFRCHPRTGKDRDTRGAGRVF